MPLLGRIQLSDEELKAIQLASDGRKQHWLGVVVARSTPAEIPPALPSVTEPGQSPAIPIEKPGGAQTEADRTKRERRQAVDAYIAECRQAGVRITRKDVWKKAGYSTRSEFERWQRNDSRVNRTAGENITRVLTEKPHLRKPTGR
jgi:hypothetical protein